MLHCAASHGHRRSACLHRLPRRYTHLIVLLKVRAMATIRTWSAKYPFLLTQKHVCVFALTRVLECRYACTRVPW
jgi:hypothetical protein